MTQGVKYHVSTILFITRFRPIIEVFFANDTAKLRGGKASNELARKLMHNLLANNKVVLIPMLVLLLKIGEHDN